LRPVILILPFFIICSAFSAILLSPMDQTSNWSFPYIASSDRATQIESAIKDISLPIKYDEVAAKPGPPDLVNDTKHDFLILSPAEENFLIANRSKVFWRSVWFVSRASRMSNLLDQWCSIYLGSDAQTVLRLLKNNIGPPSILTNYGQSGIGYGTGKHPGIDYAVAIGTPIVAVSDGTVTYMGKPFKDKWYGGGYSVGVKHGDRFFSAYAHHSCPKTDLKTD
jgi:murein DD-endopeptidase MepM/ murein hydrolase activator NlpD